MNLRIGVRDAAPLLRRLRAEGWPPIPEPEDEWYRVGDVESGQRWFVVADLGGDLLRPAQDLGQRRPR